MSVFDEIKEIAIRQALLGLAFGVIGATARYKRRQRMAAIKQAAEIASPTKPLNWTDIDNKPKQFLTEGFVELQPSSLLEVDESSVLQPELIITPTPEVDGFKVLNPTSTTLNVNGDAEAKQTLRLAASSGQKKVGRRNKRPPRFQLVDPDDLDDLPVREKMRTQRKEER